MPQVETKPIVLSGPYRAGTIALGFLFLSLPVCAYLDSRIGLLGPPHDIAAAFGLVLAILVVIGGVLLISGIVGVWLMWKDVTALSGASDPDPAGISVKADLTVASGSAESDSAPDGDSKPPPPQNHLKERPPFEGAQKPVDILDADPSFVDAARSYYEERLSDGSPFSSALVSVWRSAYGRPTYFFHVRTGSAESRWIRVPHRGKAGAGAAAE